MTHLTLTLDHVGVAVKDLDLGKQAFSRLGFTLTPRSIHSGARSPGAPVEPWGSGNHCAMFREGYLEIIGVVDPNKYSSALSMVQRYEGAHIVAVGCGSADDICTALRRRGVNVEPPRALERDAAYGASNNEKRRARFRNVYLDSRRFNEARFILIEHLTREVLWQPHLIAHPNGVMGISDVFFCVSDPDETAKKLALVFGTTVIRESADCIKLSLSRGTFWLMSPLAWSNWAQCETNQPLPSPVGIGFRVRSLSETERYLDGNGVHLCDGKKNSICIGRDDACGATIYFWETCTDGERTL